MKGILVYLWLSICMALSGEENIILVQDNINGVSVIYPVEIDMESKREYERMTEKFQAQVNGLAYDKEPDSELEVAEPEVAEPEVAEPEVAESIESIPIEPVYSADTFIISEDTALAAKLNEYVGLVPDGILSDIQDFGYKIRLVDKPNNQSGICGITLTKKKEIQIQAIEKKFRRSVIHEIGHAYDHYTGWISESPDFINIFGEEKESFMVTGSKPDGYHKTNVKEYFAEAFQMYIYDSATLQASAPQTYEFMKSIVE